MPTKYKTVDELNFALNNMNIADIRAIARDFGVVPRNRKRGDLIDAILAMYNGDAEPEVPKKSGRPPKVSVRLEQEAPKVVYDLNCEAIEDNVDPSLPREGILEIVKDGYGFVRTHNYSNTPMRDYHVSANMIMRMGLKSGDKLKVVLRQYSEGQAPTAIYVKEINDQVCNTIRRTPAYRRTSRRSYGFQGKRRLRSGLFYLRPTALQSLPHCGIGICQRPPPRRTGTGRNDTYGQHNAPWASVQPNGGADGQNAYGRLGYFRFAGTQENVRQRTQRKGRRKSYDSCDGSNRHWQQDGRYYLRRIQRYRQYGNSVGSPYERKAYFPCRRS